MPGTPWPGSFTSPHKESGGLRSASAEVGVEPSEGALDYVAAVLGAGEHMAFVFVDNELSFDAERF